MQGLRFIRCSRLILLSAALVGMLVGSAILLADFDLARANKMPLYQTQYYTIHTDLDLPLAREAAIRMTKMAEEYHQRTRDFSGVIRQRLPFYLFKSLDDYTAVGGMPGTAGVFTGQELLAYAGDEPDANTWHTVQHEGFHQFAKAVIGGEMPIWMNEGLAEYFGEAVFTGDSFQSGVISDARLQRIRAHLGMAHDQGGYRTVVELMQVSHAQWNQEMSESNYDQAWSMVQFLAHGDNGKYQDAFINFMKNISHGMNWEPAWRGSFGDNSGFEEQWRKYWTNLPADPTDTLYARANVATLTSFLARAIQQKQVFNDFDAFAKSAEGQTLKISDQDWLPASLIKTAMKNVRFRQSQGAQYAFTAASAPPRSGRGPGKPPQIVCTLPDGSKLTGTYTYTNGKVAQVNVEVTAPRPAARGASR